MNYNYTASVVDNINMNCELYEQKLGQKDMHNLTSEMCKSIFEWLPDLKGKL